MRSCEVRDALLLQLQPGHHRRATLLQILRKDIQRETLPASSRQSAKRDILFGMWLSGIHNSSTTGSALAETSSFGVQHYPEDVVGISSGPADRILHPSPADRPKHSLQADVSWADPRLRLVYLDQSTVSSPQGYSKALLCSYQAPQPTWREEGIAIPCGAQAQLHMNREQAAAQLSGRSPPREDIGRRLRAYLVASPQVAESQLYQQLLSIRLEQACPYRCPRSFTGVSTL